MNKETLNKVQNDTDYNERITFEVICNSDTSMGDGDTIKERILDYIDQCNDAMDDSMRHWGDHYHDIEPVKVELYDEDENLIDVTDDVLGETNPAAIHQIIEKTLDDLKKSIIQLNGLIPKLMDRPDELPNRSRIAYGKDLHSSKPSIYGDPDYWFYPEGVEEKIEDDKKYKVWYTRRCASDPGDMTTWNRVKYICYVPEENIQIEEKLDEILNIIF